MRRIHMARRRLALGRGGTETTISLDQAGPLIGTFGQDAEKIVEIRILMERLEVKDPGAARMVDIAIL